MTIPYFDLLPARPRRAMPPAVALPTEEEDAAVAAYRMPEADAGSDALPVLSSIDIPRISVPAPQPVPISAEALDIKRAAGDYSSAPAPVDIKAAAGVPRIPVEALPVRPSIPHYSLPSAPPGSESLPSGVPVANIPAAQPVFTPPPPARVASKGWKGRLAAIGRGALYGMGMGGQQGGMGAIGGAIAGAITGAASPNTIARWGTEADQAKWRVQHELEEQDANREAQRQNIEADNKRADATLQATIANRKGIDDDRDVARKNQELGLAIRAQAEWDQRHPGAPYPENITKVLPHLKGESAPKTPGKVVAEYSKTEIGKDGVEYGLRKDNGQWEPLSTTEGKPFSRMYRDPNEMTASQKAAEARAQEREDRADRRDERAERRDEERRINEAEGSLRKAQSAINQLRRISAAGTKATPEQIEQERANALAAVDEVVSSHPDLLEGGEGDGGFPYVKWKGGKKPAVSIPGVQSSSPAAPKPKRSSTADPLGLFK